MDMRINVNYLAACAAIAPKKEFRYYLTGVCIEPQTGIIVATDGAKMIAIANAVVADTEGVDDKGAAIAGEPLTGEPFILPRDAALAIVKAANKARQGYVLLTVDGDDISWSMAGVSQTVKRVDGKFPEWRRVIPRQTSGELAQFNPAQLAAMQDALALAVDTKMANVCLRHNGYGPGMMVCDNSDILAIVMPWRNKSDDFTAPDVAAICGDVPSAMAA